MNIIHAARRALSREALLVRKNSPHIFFVAGVAGVIGGTVLACRATLKLEKTLDECKNDLRDVKFEIAEPDGKAVAVVYAKNSLKIAKLYAPSAGVMVLSIAALTNSHVILTKRNNALMGAYSLLQTAYANYREKVREELGEDKELEIYNSVTKDFDPAGGKILNPNKMSPYARVFDETCSEYQKDGEMNRLFIMCQQNWANDILQARGHLFLNEVYTMLGFEHSSQGAIVGWVISKDGDNYVDFGIFVRENSRFVNGIEPAIWLDFNVNGVIYDKIGLGRGRGQ